MHRHSYNVVSISWRRPLGDAIAFGAFSANNKPKSLKIMSGVDSPIKMTGEGGACRKF